MKLFKWNEEKNQQLKAERNVCFEEVVTALEKGRLLARVRHQNTKKYGQQILLYVELNRYVYVVPTVEVDDVIFMKTIFPSRKATKQYLGERSEKDEKST